MTSRQSVVAKRNNATEESSPSTTAGVTATDTSSVGHVANHGAITKTAAVALSTNCCNPLEVAIVRYFQTPSIAPFDDQTSHVYMISGDDGVFQNPHWVQNLSRGFIPSYRDGILYRPEIVNEICATVEANLGPTEFRGHGLMIQGPPGIGKSHSLVNVVRKLQSTGNYLVTFLPDCEQWNTPRELVNSICASFGTSYNLLGSPYCQKDSYNNPGELTKFIEDVDAVLKKEKKQWVFVFDQINSLFTRYGGDNSICALIYPFYNMDSVIAARRITTIISISLNNEFSFKNRGFREYTHRVDMTNEELQILHPGMHNDKNVLHCTGNVPLYLQKFFAASLPDYKDEVYRNVHLCYHQRRYETKSPRDEWQWQHFVETMCPILLRIKFDTWQYHVDKIFFFERYDSNHVRGWYYPLSPMIEDAAREFFRMDIMKYIEENNNKVHMAFNESHSIDETRERVFEGLVIHRCMTMGVEGTLIGILDERLSVPSLGCIFFAGTSLPSSNVANGVYVPLDPNFPAIDMVWISGNRIFGIQIHTSKSHPNVFDKFLEMCHTAGWIHAKKEVFLLYLCPFQECIVSFAPQDDSGVETRNGVTIGYITMSSIQCLENLRLINHWLHS